MKVLLLTLALGLVCADQGSPPEKEKSEITGLWHTIYLASDNISKIAKDGPLRVYARRTDLDNRGRNLVFTFYIKVNGVCQQHTTEGLRADKDEVNDVDFNGKNTIKILYVNNRMMIIYGVNVDKHGKITHVTSLKARSNHVNPEDYKKFVEMTIKWDIPEENILNIIDTDTCPEDVE